MLIKFYRVLRRLFMKLRKFMLAFAAALFIVGAPQIKAHAAEVTENDVLFITATQGIAEMTDEDKVMAIDAPSTQETTETEEVLEASEAETEENVVVIEDAEEGDDKEDAADKKASKKNTKKDTKKEEKSYTAAELRLLSALIYCEANGEPYAGKLAVGIVAVNRMESKNFPNTLKGVVYQKYQFGPVRNGSLNRALKEYDAGRFTSSVEKDCIKAAKEALSGVKQVTYKGKTHNFKGFLFFSGRVSNAKLTIANHQFK